MEWDDLKEGMIIKWNAYFVKDYNPIIIMIKEKLNDDRYECFSTEVLSGLNYSVFDYRILLRPANDDFCTTRMYKQLFEKNSSNIEISTSEDLHFIKDRLDQHIDSYKSLYEIQKIWAKDLLKRAEKFYHECK